MKNIAAKWATNETLLQSYRSIFITTQSIFIAVGVYAVDSLNICLAISILSLVITWLIWFPVVKSRHLAVDFFKYALELSDEQLLELSKVCKNEKEYISDPKKRYNANFILKCNKQWRQTRIKIDLVMPALFTSTWLLILYVALDTYLRSM